MLSKKHQQFFKITRQISFFSEHKKSRIGCIIVKNKKTIIASGFNKNKTHPEQLRLNQKYKVCDELNHKRNLSFIHAEIDAIQSIIHHYDDLSDCVIYLYREGANGNLLDCRPCVSCLSKLIEMGVKTIYFTSPHGYHCEKIHKG